ncbi:hypothetical protein A2U01_0102324, partial [Trifolium medium]|nr:hypothetical protein [Trifolium medium]
MKLDPKPNPKTQPNQSYHLLSGILHEVSVVLTTYGI